MLTGWASAEELRIGTDFLYEKSVSTNIRPAKDGSALVLEWGELFQDDGPAAGYSYKPNQEKLSGNIRIRKELTVPNPEAEAATLLVGGGGRLKASLNGKNVELENPEKEGNYWQAYAVDPSLLGPGKNVIEFYGAGQIWIARDDEFARGSMDQKRHPNRSAKSVDGGRTWDYDHLGSNGDIDGEYYVRLHLDHFRKEGALTLPVIDIGNLGGAIVGPPVLVGEISVEAEAEVLPSCAIEILLRSGSSYVPGDKTWSKWRTESRIGKPVGRYLQIKLRLTTDSPLKTPRLKSVSIRAEPEQMGNWTSGIRIVEHHNQEIVRTGMPFRYEPFDHPKLKTLRTRFKLDEVVKGADDEFELMLRLANWASTWGGAGKKNRVGLGTKGPGYPPWDALEILKPMPDGKVWGGFCQQYNLVLLQACESFGIPGRAVSIGGPPAARGGHEVVELWSNQFKKWVYVDGDFNFAVLDSQRRPLSLLELWEEQVRVMNQKQEPQDVQFAGPGAKQAASMVRERGMYRLLRFISRSNFLVQAFPLPLNQGMRGWFWNGHYVWDDPRFPENRLYENRLLRREDVEWTLNQAHFVLEALETPGQLRVHLDTETPGFETFLLRLDGKAENAVPNTFVWPLHQGRNRMEVWPRNIAGREGIKSWIVVDYEDP